MTIIDYAKVSRKKGNEKLLSFPFVIPEELNNYLTFTLCKSAPHFSHFPGESLGKPQLLSHL